ncbi:MAG: PEP-utilizing enzyme [Acidimicrobiales bacterium]|jgi:pyruvate,water dikinase|nr:PEP-utilizing enzyme [Acidimicrobiales bacterium]MDP6299142.1 PEP-utilizing enzyme [Acidimicrobiales bacterium]HJM29426.1 PEP-utilizing enzyme [Acidimicrobiales bacterium]HJM98042.1 PEP-utilizing enzyme [Acidimicrobiales bacterium]
MLGEKWITDRTPTERFPHYTRANAGEVLADPVTPLGWTFGWESGIVLGCRDGFVSYGVFDADEYGDPPETFGLFGGYFYNCLTSARMMGVRMPGVTPEAIDDAYFDAHPDVPPYVAEDWHESPRHSEMLTETGAYLLGAESHPPTEEHKLLAQKIRAGRPDLSSLTNSELLARARSLQPHLVAMFEQHVWVSLGASNGPGILSALLAEVDRLDDVVKLLSGIGDVDSADIGRELWKLSRMIRQNSNLSNAFDQGVDDLILDRCSEEFGAAFNDFLYNHGSRGPNEWDIGADTYETKPELALSMLNSMRQQDDSADPEIAIQRNGEIREELRIEFSEMFAGNEEAAAMFAAGMQSGEVWLAARERQKSSIVKPIQEIRLCFIELASRLVESGSISDADLIFMLLEGELDEFIADPSSFDELLSERKSDFALLFDLVPPFIVNTKCAPLSEWDKRSERQIDPVGGGDVLSGVACSPGLVTGIARVILDPNDSASLKPGDILVTQNTDPAWTPLFLVAGAVVVNVGAIASHASIVSRELGIPCVASVPDASLRIPDGATITVDGSNGTVSIDQLPN